MAHTSRTPGQRAPPWTSTVTILLLLQTLVLAVFDPNVQPRDPAGPLGVTLDFEFATSFRPDGNLQNSPRAFMCSSHLRFNNAVSGNGGLTDGQLWKMAEDAYIEMENDLNGYTINLKKRGPRIMTVMAVGNEIYLSSSQRGASSFSYKYGDTPVRQALRICEMVFPQHQPDAQDKPHFNEGKCGELMATHQYYVNHKLAAESLVLLSPRPRIGTVARDPNGPGFLRYPPCPEHLGEDRDPTRWGCDLFVGTQGYQVMNPDRNAVPNQDYDLDTVAGGLVETDQVPVCRDGAPA